MTMRFKALTLVAAMVASLVPAAAAAQRAEYGVWRNPHNSVHVRLGNCGAVSCGTVVWASDAAKADAARGNTPNLVGTVLMRNFRPAPGGGMRGSVYVPDMKATFAGSISLVDANVMRARGCVLGGLICKTQVWTRVQ